MGSVINRLNNLNVAIVKGWTITGPKFKRREQYLSRDGDNPEAPWSGYGWPLESECYWFLLEGFGYRRCATGLTIQSALNRAIMICDSLRD